jgi:hypothetical protein
VITCARRGASLSSLAQSRMHSQGGPAVAGSPVPRMPGASPASGHIGMMIPSTAHSPFPSPRVLWGARTPAMSSKKRKKECAVVDDERADAPASPHGENVKVIVRIRPLNEAERGARQLKTLSLFNVDREQTHQDTLFYRVPGEVGAMGQGSQGHGHTFKFDKVLNDQASQVDVFQFVGEPAVKACLQGINATVFAYGQTGSGKTHTMHGEVVGEEEGGAAAGLTPRILEQLFAHADEQTGAKIAVRTPSPPACALHTHQLG